MNKIFYFLASALICTNLLYPQAYVNVPLIIHDDMNNTKTLYFGVDLNATNGIDSALGESDLPPLPPPGAFDTRFDLTPYTGSPLSSWRDYRNAPAFPYSGHVQHRLRWQLGEGADSLFITYFLPQYHLAALMVIKDPISGTLFNSGTLMGNGTFIITDPWLFLPALILDINYINTVPVELSSFSGIQEYRGVKLKWITTSEKNNKGFDVERKFNKTAWETISFIEGHGTTTEIQSYSYIDDFSNNFITCPIFYRLKQIDFDGTSEYSDEIKIDVEINSYNYALDQNYPNPFNPNTTIRYSIPEYSVVNINVFDILGNNIETLVDEEKPAGTYELTWTAADLPSGVYFYQLRAGAFVETKQMILTK